MKIIRKRILCIIILLFVSGCTNNTPEKVLTREIEKPLIVTKNKSLGKYSIGYEYDNNQKYASLNKNIIKLYLPILYRHSPIDRIEISTYPLPLRLKYLMMGEQNEKIDNNLNIALHGGLRELVFSGTDGNKEIEINMGMDVGFEYKKVFNDKIWIEGNIYSNINNFPRYKEGGEKTNEISFLPRTESLLGIQMSENLSLKSGIVYSKETNDEQNQNVKVTKEYNRIEIPIKCIWNKDKISIELSSGVEFRDKEQSIPIGVDIIYYW